LIFYSAVKLLPQQVEASYWLGKTLIQIGQTKEGRKELARVEQINAQQQKQATEILSHGILPGSVGNPATPQLKNPRLP
jgi:hypothetical protein